MGFKFVPAGKSSIECNFVETKIAESTRDMHFSLDINEDEAQRLVVPSGMAGRRNQRRVIETHGRASTNFCLSPSWILFFYSNMLNYTNPLVDEKNPLYCPAISAAEYLEELRFRTHKSAKSRNLSRRNLSHSFGYTLEQSSREDTNNDGSVGSDWILGDYFTSGQGWFSSQSPGAEDLPPYSPTAPVRPQSKVLQILEVSPKLSGTKPNFHDLKRKNDFSDFAAPPKYARSLLSVHDSSFDLEVWHEKLQFTGVKSSPTDAKKVLKDINPATSRYDLDRLIENLDAELPGIRLKERLWRLGVINPQSLMDFLCKHGNSYCFVSPFYTDTI